MSKGISLSHRHTDGSLIAPNRNEGPKFPWRGWHFLFHLVPVSTWWVSSCFCLSVCLFGQCTYTDSFCWGYHQDLKWLWADALPHTAPLSSMENTCTNFYPDKLWKWKAILMLLEFFFALEKPISYLQDFLDRTWLPLISAVLASGNTGQALQLAWRSPFSLLKKQKNKIQLSKF